MTDKTLSQKIIEETTKAKFLGNYKAGTPEWLALRSTGIGGSEVAVICGLSKWTSPYTLWAQKTKRLPESNIQNDAMEWGSRLEPVIIEKFEENHPEFTKLHKDVGTWCHPNREWQIANPDAIYEKEDGTLGILEIKTAMYEDDWRDGIPRYYETQVQWYMQTFDIREAWVAVLFHGNSYKEFFINASDFAQDTAITQVERFMEFITSDKAPDFDGATSTLETLRVIHPDIDVESEVELGDLGMHYMNAVAEAKKKEEEANKLKALVYNAMGKAKKGLIYGDWMLTRTARNGGLPYLTTNRKEA